MALIKCPECGKDVSDKAVTCPHCGVNVSLELNRIKSEAKPQETKKETIKKSKESLLKPSYIISFFAVILIALGLIGSTGYIGIVVDGFPEKILLTKLGLFIAVADITCVLCLLERHRVEYCIVACINIPAIIIALANVDKVFNHLRDTGIRYSKSGGYSILLTGAVFLGISIVMNIFSMIVAKTLNDGKDKNKKS